MTGSAEPQPDDDDPALVARFVDLLTLSPCGPDTFSGRVREGGRGRVFGGLVVAQALRAAQATVEDRPAHSLHAYFLRPGAEGVPIDHAVTRVRDGRSFASRAVTASEGGQAILTMSVSFHAREPGFDHQDTMPSAPDPETLTADHDHWAGRRDEIPEPARAWLTRRRAIEFRSIDRRNMTAPDRHPPAFAAWFRAVAPLPPDPALHRAVLAFASDSHLLGTCLQPHGVSWVTGVQTASLDHALWFHGDVRADDWLLYVMDSPWAGAGRGLNRGRIFSRDGRLVASVAQEAMIRPE